MQQRRLWCTLWWDDFSCNQNVHMCTQFQKMQSKRQQIQNHLVPIKIRCRLCKPCCKKHNSKPSCDMSELMIWLSLQAFFFPPVSLKDLTRHALCISYYGHKQRNPTELCFICSSTARDWQRFLQDACITHNMHIDTPLWMICHSKKDHGLWYACAPNQGYRISF